MLSRVAESIYWMSRYIERAENLARFVEVNIHLNLDSPSTQKSQWDPIIYATGDQDHFFKKYSEANQENIIQFLTFDKDYTNSIISCISVARENARSVRETISTGMWEQINKIYLMICKSSTLNLDHSDILEFYHNIKRECQLFIGITDTSLTHNEGWHFAQIGHLIERADKTTRFIDVKYYYLLPKSTDVGTPIDNIQWAALLKSVSGLEMYRKKFKRISPDSVIEFLMLNQEFPRSIHFCVIKCQQSLHEITGTKINQYRNKAEQFMGKLRSDLGFISVKEILDNGVHEYLDKFQLKLNKIGMTISESFFNIYNN